MTKRDQASAVASHRLALITAAFLAFAFVGCNRPTLEDEYYARCEKLYEHYAHAPLDEKKADLLRINQLIREAPWKEEVKAESLQRNFMRLTYVATLRGEIDESDLYLIHAQYWMSEYMALGGYNTQFVSQSVRGATKEKCIEAVRHFAEFRVPAATTHSEGPPSTQGGRR